MLRSLLLSLTLLFSTNIAAKPYSINLTETQTKALGLLIWNNEGLGQVKNLTVWNRNENFPSLGIGHFIWYPSQEKGPYVEQFPELLSYFINNGVVVPEWLLVVDKSAPWKNREAFYIAFNEPQLIELRELMTNTVSLQTRFIIKRLEKGIPDILASSSKSQQQKMKKSLAALTATPEGLFTLLDYINFKGEGISEKERYQGEGWGLKQVLLAMPAQTDNILISFALSADEMLTRRVKNAPRNEINWLKGWRVRVHKYPYLNIE